MGYTGQLTSPERLFFSYPVFNYRASPRRSGSEEMSIAAPHPLSTFSDETRTNASLTKFLHGLPGVDQVGADERAAMLSTRSIKTSAKAEGIDLAIRMIDLTTLEGMDTAGKIKTLCAKAQRPDPFDPTTLHARPNFSIRAMRLRKAPMKSTW